MTERDPALEPFDELIGTWATEATHPMFDGVVHGSLSLEWLEGGHFLVTRGSGSSPGPRATGRTTCASSIAGPGSASRPRAYLRIS